MLLGEIITLTGKHTFLVYENKEKEIFRPFNKMSQAYFPLCNIFGS